MPKKNNLSIKVLQERLEHQEELVQQYRVLHAKCLAELKDYQQKAAELEAKVKLMRLVVGKEGV